MDKVSQRPDARAKNAQLLPEARMDQVRYRRLYLIIGHKGNDRPELFFPIDFRFGTNRTEQGGKKEGTEGFSAVFIFYAAALTPRVLDQFMQVGNPVRVRQGGDSHSVFPGHPHPDFRQFFLQPFPECFLDILMDKKYLQGGAPLSVEGEGSEDGFADGGPEVGIGQDDDGVFSSRPSRLRNRFFLG